MRLNNKAYNGEIGHCIGKNKPVCGRCLRRALYDTWRQLGDRRESIILMVPKATALGCELRIFMPYGYEQSKRTPADWDPETRKAL